MATLVSGLKVGAKIGAGAFGEVYLGEDDVHGRVAVKMLSRKAHWADEDWNAWRTAFLAEAQNLSLATHANVVKVHHIVAEDSGERILYCMEFCSGGSLQTPYELSPLSLLKVRDIATDVLLGLQALHARGLLHRDIKPANILLNGQGHAKIGDFGLVTDNIAFGYASQAGYLDHLAREVWQGSGTSVRSDIWALGVTLYRLLHGKTWYDELPDPRGIIEHGGFALGLSWLPHVPKVWRKVLRKMMHDDTAKRYETTDQVLSGVSNVTVNPSWQTTVEPEVVRWQLQSAERLKVVEWKRSARQHEWSAWSKPLPGATGRRKTLAGSGGIVTGAKALTELEHYFEASNF